MCYTYLPVLFQVVKPRCIPVKVIVSPAAYWRHIVFEPQQSWGPSYIPPPLSCWACWRVRCLLAYTPLEVWVSPIHVSHPIHVNKEVYRVGSPHHPVYVENPVVLYQTSLDECVMWWGGCLLLDGFNSHVHELTLCPRRQNSDRPSGPHSYFWTGFLRWR